MRKIICDNCKKEIKEDDQCVQVEMRRIKGVRMYHYDLCIECAEALQKVFERENNG